MSELPSEMTGYQCEVAKLWIDRAVAVGRARSLRYTADFEFVAYFAAFNALYWLHSLLVAPETFTREERRQVESALEAGKVPDSLQDRVLEKLQPTMGEEKQIRHLVGMLPEEFAAEMVEKHKEYIEYLGWWGPVRRMGKRTLTRHVGEEREGLKHFTCLRDDTKAARERLQAMAGVLYLIRCNLVHGSKGISGTDQDLLERSVGPLGDIAIEALKLTKRLAP